jgi:hypothetical protein
MVAKNIVQLYQQLIITTEIAVGLRETAGIGSSTESVPLYLPATSTVKYRIEYDVKYCITRFFRGCGK